MKDQGLFIVIEGSDGSGKGTQFKILAERLKAVGYDVATFDFPQYDNGSSYFVKKYLNGEYGPGSKINPYVASLFYALDRYDASMQIKSALNSGKIVLANRFTGSNMAHQGANFKDDIERRSYFVWDDNLEFELLGIPRPNLNIYLRVPADISYELIANKNARSYTAKTRDELEQDIKYQRKVVATYDLLSRLFPKDFTAINCTKKGKLLSIPEINNLVWEQIKPLLPAKKQHASHSVVVTLGSNQEPGQPAKPSGDGILTHQFRDASLLLRLTIQRLVPQAVAHTFDGWKPGNYSFYTPGRMPKAERQSLKDGAEQLSILHQQLLHKMSAYIDRQPADKRVSPTQLLQPLIPLGALSDFTVSIKKDDVRRVTTNLLANDSEELQWAAKQLYLAARQLWPQDFDSPLETGEGPAALNKIIASLSGPALGNNYSMDESIQLVERTPRLEFDLLAESIYPYSSISRDEISQEVASWPYSQKFESLKEMAQQPETLKKVRYKFDILSDQITLDKIAQVSGALDVQVQAPTPRYGYEMPKLVDSAAADDLYDAVFDESLKLYSQLQAAGRDDMAPYATLLGHKVRWQFNATANELKKVVTDKQLSKSPVVKAIAEKLAETHPLLWEVVTNGQPVVVNPLPKGKARVKPASRRGSKPKKS